MTEHEKLRGKLNELQQDAQALDERIDERLRNAQKVAEESERAADVAHDAPKILDDLDREFEQMTKLNGLDVTFLFLATAIQCVRWYILSNIELDIKSDKENDALVGGYVKKYTPKSWHDILLASVPYDAIRRDHVLKEAGESVGLSGKNHRYMTLGHDPLAGWIFGTANILSDTLTKYDFTSRRVRDMVIFEEVPTTEVFSETWQQIQANKWNLPTAIARQAIHFGSDYFTKQGLPIPLLMTVDNDFTGSLIEQGINIRTGFNVMKSAILAEFVNMIIACVHKLFYDPAKYSSPEIYDVKTRMIITYSNIIASSSNIIYAAISKDLKRLDVGGILVTLWKLIRNRKFKQEVKREFITERFNEMIRGEDYDFE